MVTTRIDSNQLLQVYQPQTQSWTQAVTLVQLAGGIDVALTGSQGVAIQQIAFEIQNLSDLLSAVQASNNLSGIIAANSSQISTAILSGTNSSLGSISAHVIAIEAHQAIIEQSLNSLIAAVNLQNQNLVQLKSTIIDQAVDTILNYIIRFITSDSEYSLLLPPGTKTIRFRSRKVSSSFVDIRYAFQPGQVTSLSTGLYSSLAGGSEYRQEGLGLTGSTIYFSATGVTGIAEIEAYS